MTTPGGARSVLVVAPHQDDELLGAGGTLLRCKAEGWQVTICFVAEGDPAEFGEAAVSRVRAEAAAVVDALGATEIRLGFPAAHLSELPQAVVNRAMTEAVQSASPDLVLLPHIGDIHLDHRVVTESAMVALRPGSNPVPRTVLAYETLSETNWNFPSASPAFVPSHFIDISPHLDGKLELLSNYQSQLRTGADERTLASVEYLARLRGASVGVAAAEAFMPMRVVHHAGDLL